MTLPVPEAYVAGTGKPPQQIIDAMESGLVEIVRRVEIYEADGVTLWSGMGDQSRLVDGNVNIDYSSDERRNIDLTLDNFDQALRPNPNGGLWYDKVIKPYRGIKYNPSDIDWPLAIIEAPSAAQGQRFSQMLSSIGFNSNEVRLDVSDPGVLAKYSIIAAVTGVATTSKAATLKSLFEQGKTIVTVGVGNGVDELPHYATTPTTPTITNMIGNPSAETPGQDIELFRNVFPNPRAVGNTGFIRSWPGPAGNAFTHSEVVSTDSVSGKSHRWVWSARGTNAGDVSIDLQGSIVAGTVYTARYKLKSIEGGVTSPPNPYAGSGGVATLVGRSRAANKTFAAGEIEDVWVTFSMDATGAAAADARISSNIQGTTPVSWEIFDVVITATQKPVEYFSGAGGKSGGYWDDDDFTFAWVGTVDASASQARGKQWTGPLNGLNGAATFGGLNARLVRSNQWKKSGDYSLRIIPGLTGTPVDTAANVGLGTAHDGKTFTIQATFHLEKAQTAPDGRARRILSYGQSTTNSNIAPNVAGDTFLKLTFVAGGTIRNLRLYSGAGTFGEDAWYDDIVMVEGTYDGDYFEGAKILYGIAPVSTDSPLAGSFAVEAYATPVAGTAPSGVAAGVQRVASWPDGPSPTMVTAAIARSANGGYWLDIHLPEVYGAQAKNLLRAALNYMRGAGRVFIWEVPLGEYFVDGITTPNFPPQVRITGRDATKKLMNDKLPQTSTWPVGTSLRTWIIQMLALGGIPVAKQRINIGNETFTSEMTFERGTSRWDMIKSALESYNYERFCDGYGNFVVRKFLDPTTSPISQTFGTGPEGNLVTFDKSVNDSRIYNDVIVTADPADSDSNPVGYFGRASVTDASSPVHKDKIGNRTLPVDAPWLSSDEECIALAQERLKITALESYELNFSSIYYPWFDGGEIVDIADPDALDFEPSRFLMDSITYPFGLGPMSATGKRVTFVGQSGSPE